MSLQVSTTQSQWRPKRGHFSHSDVRHIFCHLSRMIDVINHSRGTLTCTLSYLVWKHLERMNMNDSKVETSEQVDGWRVLFWNLIWLVYYFNVKSSVIFYLRSISSIFDHPAENCVNQPRRIKTELNYPRKKVQMWFDQVPDGFCNMCHQKELFQGVTIPKQLK